MLARGAIVTTRDKTSHAKHVISLHHPNMEKTWLSSGTVDAMPLGMAIFLQGRVRYVDPSYGARAG